MDIAEKLKIIAENEQKVYNAGYEKGNIPMCYAVDLYKTYSEVILPENFEMVLRVKEIKGDLYQAFYRTQNLKSVKLIIDNKEQPLALHQTFRECSSIEVVDLTETSRKIKKMDYCFLDAANLISIIGALDLSLLTVDNYAFFAVKLENIEIVPNTLKVSMRFASGFLTDASVESIINGLADLTGGATQTLTLNGILGGKLTEEQRARITAKNWTLVY